MGNDTIIQRIKNNDEALLKKIYLENKLSFFKIVNQYQIPEDIALDIYQDCMVALIENARRNMIDNLQSNINTYFIGIGKFMIYNHLKSLRKYNLQDIESIDLNNYENYTTEDYALNDKELALKKAYETLGDQCKQILNLFYFENKKLDEIQTILNYENKDVLKSQKSRCVSHLKKLLNPKK